MQMIGWSPLLDGKERGHINLGVHAAGTKSIYIDANNIDSLSVQLTWAGTLAATVTVFCSNSFIPDKDDMQANVLPERAGSFTDITARVVKTADPAGAPGSQDIEWPFPVRQGFYRIDVARTAGSGQLDSYTSGKVIGK